MALTVTAPSSDAGIEHVVIVAGGGTLPLELRDSLVARGAHVSIIGIKGFATAPTRLASFAMIEISEAMRLIELLSRLSPSVVTLVGGVSRPSVGALMGLLRAARNRAELAVIMDPLKRAGDDGLLRGVVAFIERHGFVVKGLAELCPNLLAPSGRLGRHAPSAENEPGLALAERVLTSLSPYDIGQAVVVQDHRVLAIEGPEGTDRMLRRVRYLRQRFFRLRERGGVLVKMPKVGQDMRVDLPAVGPRTVARAREAGLVGIAVAARATLIVDKAATIAAADRAGLFLLGVGDRRDGW